jgi:hypothetical protein
MCHDCVPTHSNQRIGCGCRFRQFLSPEEEVERLESYKEQLNREAIGVETRIEELREKTKM